MISWKLDDLSNYQLIMLKADEERTKKDLIAHPLASQL
jgi:hypothetical protein